MSDEYGPTFLTVTDDDGNEIVLEFVDALEHNGQVYQAFFPAEVALSCINCALVVFAITFASVVLPVPGGP